MAKNRECNFYYNLGVVEPAPNLSSGEAKAGRSGVCTGAALARISKKQVTKQKTETNKQKNQGS